MKTPVVILTGCDSIKQGFLKTSSDTLRLLSCLIISGCDSLRLGVLKPNKQDTLRLLSCIKISGCDSLKYGLIKTSQDTLRLGCNIVTIGNQKWMKENLDVVTYRNGDTIPQVTDIAAWDALTTGAWCYYKNDAAYGAIYGKLYNFHAVNDLRGLAPQGWHIPTDTEWTTLSNFLGDNAGNKMKTAAGWYIASQGTNESGFSGLPGGKRENNSYSQVGYVGYWWSATEYVITQAWMRTLDWSGGGLNSYIAGKKGGYSVRCIKN